MFKCSILTKSKSLIFRFYKYINLSIYHFKLIYKQMSENHNSKSKEQYSRNVKILKVKLNKLSERRLQLEQKIKNAKNSTNEKIIALKLAKFAKQRHFTPEMLFRFIDRSYRGEVNQHDFKAYLLKLGCRLSNDEFIKFNFLVDENLSGTITAKEYYNYLSAFNIRAEATTEQPFIVGGVDKLTKALLKNTLPIQIGKDSNKSKDLKKVDTDNILKQIQQQNQRRIDDKKLMNYQQFYRYCKTSLPQSIQDKQIMSIFNRLDYTGEGYITLEQLNLFLKQNSKRDAQLKKKNSQDKLRREDSKRKKDILTKKQSQKNKQGDISPKKRPSKTDINPQNKINFNGKQISLQNKIKLVLNQKIKNKYIIHLNDFKKVGAALGPDHQLDFYQLFKQIDDIKKGSIDINQIINYYLNHKTQDQPIDYAFEIMRFKIESEGIKFDQMMNTYSLNEYSELNDKLFARIMRQEFQISETNASNLFKTLPDKNRKIFAKYLEDKFNGQKKSNQENLFQNQIPLNYFGTKPKDFFRNGVGSILKNPLVALQFCLQLETKLLQQNKKFWSDYQFGPNPNDKFGYHSITGTAAKIDIFPSEQQLMWIRTNDIGFIDFYYEQQENPIYQLGKCNDQGLLSALSLLSRQSKNYLWKQLPQNQQKIEKLTEKQFSIVATGIYPKIFHTFAKYGIYVFRFFIQETWIYVIIDDKLPCHNNAKDIIFSSCTNKKYAWISLIEKAYAKAHGSYLAIYNKKNIFQCCYELSRVFCIKIDIPNNIEDNKIKDSIWLDINSLMNKQKGVKIINSKKSGLLNIHNFNTQFQGLLPHQVIHLSQIKNPTIQNYHKSHRLIIIKTKKQIDDLTWNQTWSNKIKNDQQNKFTQNQEDLEKQLKDKKIQSKLTDRNIHLINYQKFRSIFDTIFCIKEFNFNNWTCYRLTDRLQKKQIKIKIKPKDRANIVFTVFAKGDSINYEQILNLDKLIVYKKQSSSPFEAYQSILDSNEYALTIKSNQLLIFSFTIYFERNGKVQILSQTEAKFIQLQQLQKIAIDVENRDQKTNEFVQKVFKIPHKTKPFWCC